MIEIEARLDELKALGCHQRTRLVSGPQGPHVVLDGKPVLLLCSDNYLGLADHPRVRGAAADAAMRWGVGAGASRLGAGTMTIHQRLEDRLAEFSGRDSALLFGSGYLAAVGTITALARPGDVVFADDDSHAATIDGCRLSGAEVFVYDHADADHLAWGIEHAKGRGALIVTDSVFSLGGDVAPLDEIVRLAERFGLRTVVDETHAIGALGPGGRGALAEAGLQDHVDVVIGSLGAALGAYGGFAVCDRDICRYLVGAARTFAFSTAPPPPALAGALAALELLGEKPRSVAKLATNAAVLRGALIGEGFDLGMSRTQILPLMIGDAELALRLGDAALTRGVFAQAIRPPAVPAMSARLRLAVMATHREEELLDAARILGAVARKLGLPRREMTAPRAPEPVVSTAGADAEYPESRHGGVFDFEAPEPIRRAA